jgi:KUP system potassium uptake protein
MPRWQDDLFVALPQFSDDASNSFRLPSDRVVEIGAQVTV